MSKRTFGKSRNSQNVNTIGGGVASRMDGEHSPKNFKVGHPSAKLVPKMGTKKNSANLPARTGLNTRNYGKYQVETQKLPSKVRDGKSPTGEHETFNVENDDYDEETDEFAVYRGKSPKDGDKDTTKSSVHTASTKKSKSGKSDAVREREKNIKEIKMYYWTKVDTGDRDEVIKILQFARSNFAKDNEFNEIVNCTNSDGFTPLHLASSEGHANMIDVLIKFGAQVDARTNNFRTPLHIACLRGNLNVIQTLVANGADINAKDIESNTPCHFVSEYGHRLCLKFLLERNPYLFANNNEDKSAIDVAISSDILNEF